MFELGQEEYNSLRSHFATLKQGAHTKYLPYAFTEHGVLMLSNILKSGKAVETSIRIIDVFVKLRETILSNKDVLLKLEQLDKKLIHLVHDVKMHDGEIETIFELINDIREEKKKLPPPKNPIGFKTKSTKK